MNHHPIKAYPLQNQQAILNQEKPQRENRAKKPISNHFLDNFTMKEEENTQMRRSKSSNFLQRQQQVLQAKKNQIQNSESLQENSKEDYLQQGNSVEVNGINNHKRTQSSIINSNYGINKPQKGNLLTNNNGTSYSFVANSFSSTSQQGGKSGNHLNKSHNGKLQLQNDLSPDSNVPKSSSLKNTNKIVSNGKATPLANRYINKGLNKSHQSSLSMNYQSEKLPKLEPFLQNNSSGQTFFHHQSNSISSKEQLKQKLQSDLFKDPNTGYNSMSPNYNQTQGKAGSKININLQIKNLNIISGGNRPNNQSYEKADQGDQSLPIDGNPSPLDNSQNNLYFQAQNTNYKLSNSTSGRGSIGNINQLSLNSQDQSKLIKNQESQDKSTLRINSPLSRQSIRQKQSNSKEKKDVQSPINNYPSSELLGKIVNSSAKQQAKSTTNQLLQSQIESQKKGMQKQLGTLLSDTKLSPQVSGQKSQNSFSIVKDQSIENIQQQNPPQPKNIVSSFAVKSKAGSLPGKPVKTNQDSYIITTNFCKNRQKYYFGICDGHGVNGHLASQYVKKILCSNIEFFMKQHCKDDYGPNFDKTVPEENLSAIEKSLTSGFLKTASNLLDSGIDITFSGSTCVGVYVSPQRFWCANIGDSRAIVGRQDSLGIWSNQYLSIDHKPDLPSEQQRIIKSGGRVEPFKDQEGNPIGPARVWMRYENIPGLAMSRSFGDYVASQVGVIQEPQVLHYDFNPNDKFLVVASDGIWEFLQNEDVVNMISSFYYKNDPDGACEKLVKEATAAWKREDEVVDDITIIVVFFNK